MIAVEFAHVVTHADAIQGQEAHQFGRARLRALNERAVAENVNRRVVRRSRATSGPERRRARPLVAFTFV